MKKQVLGVKIDDVNLNKATEIVESWLSGKGKHYIVTTNPEFIMTAQRDSEFKKILNNSDLSIPDGKGLRIGTDIVCNTPGIDLMEALIKLAEEKGLTTGFLGGRGEVAQMTANCLIKKYSKLKVTFVSEEPNVMLSGTKDIDLLFVAFGHPKQEKWIFENLKKIPVKVAMGVGGAFDFFSGRVPRAPLWVRNLGLEWLFRLVVQPWRIKRQFALLKYLVLIWRHGH